MIIVPRQIFLGRILPFLRMLLLVDVSEKVHYSIFGIDPVEKSDRAGLVSRGNTMLRNIGNCLPVDSFCKVP